MATNKVVVAGSDVTASQLKDFFRQIDDGSITGEVVQAVLERRNPFAESDYFVIVDDGTKKTSELLAECRQKFAVTSYYSDEMLDEQFKPPAKPTSRRFRRTVEADPGNANKSANDLNQVDQITLRERIIMELAYFRETGQHLDISNITLCGGSRGAGGRVPRVRWLPGSRELCVRWASPDGQDGDLRSRSAVS